MYYQKKNFKEVKAITLIEQVITISLWNGFAIFGTYAGEVYGIGRNDYGQLGTGDNKGASTFVRCEELEN